MPKHQITHRLAGIQTALNGVHEAGVPTSAIKDNEREAFVERFLSQVLLPPYRFGTGDVIDLSGRQSGHLDVIVESPMAPSLPLGFGESRLYLAEGVAAAIEVKSDVAAQWEEVRRTAESLLMTRRYIEGAFTKGDPPSPRIPLYAVGYTGWKQIETVREYLRAAPGIEGILVIDPGIFVDCCGVEIDGGALALWGLISGLYESASELISTHNNPLMYAV